MSKLLRVLLTASLIVCFIAPLAGCSKNEGVKEEPAQVQAPKSGQATSLPGAPRGAATPDQGNPGQTPK